MKVTAELMTGDSWEKECVKRNRGRREMVVVESQERRSATIEKADVYIRFGGGESF